MKHLSKKKKFLVVAFCSVVVVLSVFFGVVKNKQYKNKKDKIALIEKKIRQSAIKNFVCEKLPEIKRAQTDLDKVRLLRDFVYSNSVIGPNNSIDYQNFGIENIKNWYNRKDKYSFDNIAYLFHILASSFGLESRVVYMYANSFYSGTSGDTHVSNEIKINNNWVAQDPTFNIEFQYNNKLLSYEKLFAFNENNSFNKVSIESNGFKILPKRSLNEYYIPHHNLLANIKISDFDYNKNKLISQKSNWYISKNSAMYDTNKLAKYKPIIKNITLDAANKDVDIVVNDFGCRIKTNSSKYHYQLKKNLELDAGEYYLVINGKLLKGNISLGVLNNNKWLSQVIYEKGSATKKNGELINYSIPFSINKKQKVTFIVSNANFAPTNSIFFIKKITLLNIDAKKIIQKKQEIKKRKQEIKKYLYEQLPELSSTIEPLKKVRLLRNFVYKNTVLGNSGKSIINIADLQQWQKGEIKIICGGMSHLLCLLLDSLDIKSRVIDLRTNGFYINNNNSGTHVATEVFINGRWLIEDPTFNIEFYHKGKTINFKKLFKLNEEEKYNEVSYSTNGYNLIKNRSIDTYYLSYDQFLSCIIITNYAVDFSKYQPEYLISKNSFFRTGKAQKIKTIPVNLKELKPANKNAQFNFLKNKLNVTSNRSKAHYQVTKNINLPAGNYLVVFKGKITEGGVALGAIDTSKNKWLTSQIYDASISTKYPDISFPNLFKLNKDTIVKITISNCNQIPDISKFSIENMQILKLKD